MRLFNLFFCLYEVLLRYHDEGDVDEWVWLDGWLWF
jgi:hypothetical protein